METALPETFDEEIPLFIDRWKMFAGLAALALLIIGLLAVMYFVGTRKDPRVDMNPDNPSIPLLHSEGEQPAGDGLPVVEARPAERKRPRAAAPPSNPPSEPAPAPGGGPITL